MIKENKLLEAFRENIDPVEEGQIRLFLRGQNKSEYILVLKSYLSDMYIIVPITNDYSLEFGNKNYPILEIERYTSMGDVDYFIFKPLPFFVRISKDILEKYSILTDFKIMYKSDIEDIKKYIFKSCYA